MRHYRIVNKFRFICFVTLVILLITNIFIAVLGLSDVSAKQPENYVEVEVVAGDTLWQLAERYGSDDKDIRQVVYEICKINDVSAESLKAGQVLYIPAN